MAIFTDKGACHELAYIWPHSVVGTSCRARTLTRLISC